MITRLSTWAQADMMLAINRPSLLSTTVSASAMVDQEARDALVEVGDGLRTFL